MNDNNIDQFRAEIRERLRECQNKLGEGMVANHSKFNEDLEFRLAPIKDSLPPNLYDTVIQTANYGYMQGTMMGLQVGNEKVQSITANVEKMRKAKEPIDYRPQIEDLIKVLKGGIGLGVVAIGLYILCQLLN